MLTDSRYLPYSVVKESQGEGDVGKHECVIALTTWVAYNILSPPTQNRYRGYKTMLLV